MEKGANTKPDKRAKSLMPRLWNPLTEGQKLDSLSDEDLTDFYARGERNFDGANISYARVGGEDLPEISLNSANAESSSFSDCDLHNTSFNGANLSDVIFDYCNLSKASFNDAELVGASFLGSDIVGADFSSIRINGKSIELGEASITISSPNVWHGFGDHSDAGDCKLCEVTNHLVLSHIPNDNEFFAGDFAPADKALERARRGIVLFWEDRPIGYIKLKGDPSFLPLRTVRDTNGEVILWKGMVYAIGAKLTAGNLLKRSIKFKNARKWLRVDMKELVSTYGQNELSVCPLRFLNDHTLYEKLDELLSRLEAGQEPVIPLPKLEI